MTRQTLRNILPLLAMLLLWGCAASHLPGYQNTYQGYKVPETLVERIRADFKRYGLPDAQVARDNAGRIRLTGSYRDEDEVDRAFIIVQSTVGMKSTSPFYPENVREKRWEADARRALAQFTQSPRASSGPSAKRALIVGINKFLDPRLTDILGEDDARRVDFEARKAGFQTTTLLGPQATKANIEAALKQLKSATGPNDSLLIYISSHGTQPTPSPRVKDARKMSIAAYDTGDPAVPGVGTNFRLKVHETSVPDTDVQELARTPTRQTRVIIDTCYSGEILKDIPDESARYILKTNGGTPERAGISISAWSGDAYQAKGIVFSNENAAASNGKPDTKNAPDLNRYTIITATSDDQLSWGPSAGGSFESPVEKGKLLKGSFFTQAFFEYLGKFGGHLEPAFDAARKFTLEKVAQIPAEQRPRLNPPLPAGDPTSIYE
jgi:hypothetical protein